MTVFLIDNRRNNETIEEYDSFNDALSTALRTIDDMSVYDMHRFIKRIDWNLFIVDKIHDNGDYHNILFDGKKFLEIYYG